LSGSQTKAPGFAGGYLLNVIMIFVTLSLILGQFVALIFSGVLGFIEALAINLMLKKLVDDVLIPSECNV